MNEKKESEFVLKVGAFAKETNFNEMKMGEKKGMIILAAEKVGEDQSHNLVGVSGDGETLANALANFLSEEKYQNLLHHAIEICRRKKAEKAFEKFVEFVKNS